MCNQLLKQRFIKTKFYLSADTFNLEYLLDNPDQENPTKAVSLMFQLMKSVLVMTIENHDVQKLLNDPTEEFDVVIVEWMFLDLLSG